jgi:hypothetical protein
MDARRLGTGAGLPQTFPALDVMKVNFIGMRHWTESWIPKMRRGSGVVTIAWVERRQSQDVEITRRFDAGMIKDRAHRFPTSFLHAPGFQIV